MNQLFLLLPGQVVYHPGGEWFEIAENQNPGEGLEWLAGPETVWVWPEHTKGSLSHRRVALQIDTLAG